MRFSELINQAYEQIHLVSAQLPSLSSLYQEAVNEVSAAASFASRLFESKIDRAVRLVTSKDEFDRLKGISLLGLSGSDRAVDYLLDSLNMENSHCARNEILGALSKLTPSLPQRCDEIASVFIDLLESSEKQRQRPLVTMYLREALELCKDVEFHERVFLALEERFIQTDWTGRISCKKGFELITLVSVLGSMKDFSSSDCLGELLLQSHCPVEQKAIVEAIERRAPDENLHFALANFLKKTCCDKDDWNCDPQDSALEVLTEKYWC